VTLEALRGATVRDLGGQRARAVEAAAAADTVPFSVTTLVPSGACAVYASVDMLKEGVRGREDPLLLLKATPSSVDEAPVHGDASGRGTVTVSVKVDVLQLASLMRSRST
jgi:hypothetical protein